MYFLFFCFSCCQSLLLVFYAGWTSKSFNGQNLFFSFLNLHSLVAFQSLHSLTVNWTYYLCTSWQKSWLFVFEKWSDGAPQYTAAHTLIMGEIASKSGWLWIMKSGENLLAAELETVRYIEQWLPCQSTSTWMLQKWCKYKISKPNLSVNIYMDA